MPTQWTCVAQAPGAGERQGSLECCSLRGRRVRRDKASEPPGIEPVTSAEEAQRPNLSIAREFPTLILFKS